MYKKQILLIIILLLMLTGCQKLNNNNIDNIIDTILTYNQKVNTVSTNYEIFLPNNVISIEDNEFNQILKIKNKYIYLYVDTTSYYYKNALNYEEESPQYNYLYKKINKNKKTGYIGIRKNENNYYCKIIYNYAKIEFYSDEEHLNYILANSLMMINSIKYNDKLINSTLGDVTNSGREQTYKFATPEGSTSNFSEYLEESIIEEDEDEVTVELPDEE